MDKLRLGIIGTGSVVREIYQHLYLRSEYSHLLSIEAVCNRSPGPRDEFGELLGVPRERRFESYEQMIREVPLDAVQINTPDHMHEAPTIFALEHGLDVMLPKPTADTIAATHRMIAAARKAGRLLAIDFHKRDDPRLKEAAARYQSGQYGQLQATIWYMLDKLYVADPNHVPRFFASPDYAERNTPISFLTVHMADALMGIVNLRPVSIRANAWSQKLPSLKPIAVNGYDMCDTELSLENGAVAHILTGWHLPNTAHATTVQSARMICTDGVIDLGLDTPGYCELTAEGIAQRNCLFRNFERDGTVTGYGISRPGRIYQKFLSFRNGTLSADEQARMMNPVELGFWTTVVLEAAEKSLRLGERNDNGVVHGKPVDVRSLLRDALGTEADGYL